VENGDHREDVHGHAELVDHVRDCELLGEDDLVVEHQQELALRQLACKQVGQLVLIVALELGSVREEDQDQQRDHQRLEVFLGHALDLDLLVQVAVLAHPVALAALIALGVLDLHAVHGRELNSHE